MPCTTPPSTSGSREPLGWTCRTVRSWTPWWTSPMPWGGHGSTPMEAHARGRARPSPLVAGRSPRLARQRAGDSSSPALAGDAGMPRRCVSHRCDRAFCRGGSFSYCRGQLGFGSHLGSIASRLLLYTFGTIVDDTHKFQYRTTGVQLLHCCQLLGDGKWTAMATHAFPCR